MNDTPRTVADAMIVCQRLDVSYLWVDRFCIIQDDEGQKHAQIEVMHDIYSNATFTICASAATNSQDGLCGVGETPRPFSRPRAQVAGMDILPVLPDISDSVINRQWNSRGWTFQEFKLSKKILIFTEWQLFFKCHEEIRTEDYLTETGNDFFVRLISQEGMHNTLLRKTPFGSYAACVDFYNARSLSYESDIYKAFTGILGRLYTSLEECKCGIPEKDFDAALLWEIESPNYSTRKRPRIIQNIALPTWAWASLTGYVEFKGNIRSRRHMAAY